MMSGTADDVISFQVLLASVTELVLVFQETLHNSSNCEKAGFKEQLLYRIVNLKGNVVTNGSN